MKNYIQLALALCLSMNLNAQNIEFQSAEPHPYIQGALMGDSEMADVDGDGDLDLFVCGRINGWSSADSTRLYLNDGAGMFEEAMDMPFQDVQFASAQFNDVDNDGDLDLMLTGLSGLPGQIAELYINDGNASFELAINTPFPGCQDSKLDFGDVNDDGFDDLFICGSASESLFCELYLNNGDGSFAADDGSPFNGLRPSDVKLIDVDGDADLDVLVLGVDEEDASLFQIYLNDGNADFSMLANDITPLSAGTFDAGDLDQDGDADILISGQNTDFLASTELYLNDGNASFSFFEGSDVFLDVFAGQVLFHDLDADDDLDILLSGSSDGGLGSEFGIVSNVYESLGGNNFVLADSLTGSYISNNAIGDFNGDGLPDLVLSGTTVGTPNFKTWVYSNTTEDIVGVEDQEIEAFKVFPNPTSGVLNIDLGEFNAPSLEVYSVTGELVFNLEKVMLSVLSIELDVPDGFYTIVIADSTSQAIQKICVRKEL